MTIEANSAGSTPAPVEGGAAATPTRSNAMTREEVRAKATSGMTRSERTKRIQEAIAKGRNALEGEPAREPSPSPQPEVEQEDLDVVAQDALPPEADEGREDASVDDEVDVETLEDFLEAAGLEPDDFKKLKTKLKVEGEEVELSIGDAFSGTQLAKANTELRQQLRNQQRAQQAQAEEAMKVYGQHVQAAQQQIWAAQQVLQAEINAPDMQALRQSDPHAYLQLQDMNQRRIQELQQRAQQIQAHQQQTQLQFFEQQRSEARKRLMEAVPDIESPERKAKIYDVFKERGVSMEDASAIIDDRLIAFVSDYADMKEELTALKEAQAKAERKAKNLARASKSSRAGSRSTPKRTSAQQQEAAALDNMKGKKGLGARRAAAEAIRVKMANARNRR